MDRWLTARLKEDLEHKLVILSGPRQVGKTWLSKQLVSDPPNALYLNWDDPDHRRIIADRGWLPTTSLLVLDEVHKMPDWKNHLKGVWDTKPTGLKILVTGSARLETFRQVGDSLAGRYLRHRLLPICPFEAARVGDSGLDRLLERGGFPEPYLASDAVRANRWRKQYVDGLLREDLLSFERIHELSKMQMLVELLRERVGSLLSWSSLAEDLRLSPATVERYVEILEALYIVFRVQPWARDIARSVGRKPKVYFFDNALVRGDAGAKLENLAAVALQKLVWAREDAMGRETSLHYLRTRDGREVDFCLIEDGSPVRSLEIKTTFRETPMGQKWFLSHGIPGTVLCGTEHRERIVDGLEVRDLGNWIREAWEGIDSTT
jgi:hypothetical protein